MQTGTAANWSTVQPLAKGQRGTLRTLRAMATFCRRDAASQELRDIALSIIGHVPGHDFQNEVNALYHYARGIRYRRDPVQVERVQDALRTIQYGTGDCDDKTVLLVSLLATVGHRARFVVCGQAPGRWSHVYCEVQTKRGWLPLDPTPESALPGWEMKAPCKGVFEVWPMSGAVRVVRSSEPVQVARMRQQPVAAFPASRELKQYLAGQRPCQCGKFVFELEDGDLGADKYEWKVTGPNRCEPVKKSCGFWCKIGNAFKTIGKWALVVAPIALAPFTAGGSLALTGATGTAVTISSAAASAAGAIITKKYTGNLPGDAQIDEPKGECLRILQAEAAAEAQRIAAEEQARAEAEAKRQAELQAAQAKAIVAAIQKESGIGFSLGSLTSNPLLLAGAILGGAVLLSRS